MAKTGYMITVYQDINPSSSTYKYVREERVKDEESCPTASTQYRWVVVSGSFMCSGYDKYSIEKQQVSTDGGTTWTDTETTRTGSLVETNSEDCGYTPTPATDYSSEYFTIEAIKKTSIGLVGINYASRTSVNFSNIQYSLNGAEWNDWNTSNGYYMDLNVGDKLRLKAYNNAKQNDGLAFTSRDLSDYQADYNVYGNINSLYDGMPTTNSGYSYQSLFEDNMEIGDASNLVLPATTLANGCYLNMFSDCTNLTSAPALPATTLAEQCYSHMFYNCRSLTSAPALPATTLADGCYLNMFYGCLSLVTAPDLPATTLTPQCYSDMFSGCSSLVNAPQLPATALAEYCYDRMFKNCTSLTSAPALPATTLVTDCYDSMFYNCTSLNYIRCLATVITTDFHMHTYDWVYNVASSGIFVKSASMSDWTTGVCGIPKNWSVINQ